MTGNTEGPGGPGAWEFLLAHHFPDRYGRTLRIAFRGKVVHACARCSGQVLGVLAFLVLYGVMVNRTYPLFSTDAQLLMALAPLPAAWDWLTQSLGRRESVNRYRVVSGMFLGLAFADLVALVVTGRWTLVLGGLLVFVVYVLGILATLKVTGGWRKVLEEHFPGVRLRPMP